MNCKQPLSPDWSKVKSKVVFNSLKADAAINLSNLVKSSETQFLLC